MQEPEARALTRDDISRLLKVAKESLPPPDNLYFFIPKSLWDDPGSRAWFERNFPGVDLKPQELIPNDRD
jgi:hypothetical protein